MNERTNIRTRLILASASPRRRELLSLFEIDFDVQPADIDETVREGEPPENYVRRMSREKAMAIHGQVDDCFVLGSDTAVVLDDECLGKPGDDEQAREMLERLSGREHRVLSAVALAATDGGIDERLSVTRVEFAQLPAAWIDRYVASGEPHDKAGAYGIQGAAGIWVRSLSGSYTGVVGLPLFETGELLREARLAD
ncbi:MULTISPECIES: nucleoside triphosphate pyrophosphatase [unclassified Wenzhouxiangella]|uniref:Maf family protein n=1 Tax=unclassified Wenzhouxiangella TaxID=2613841 RepID=UPI000E32B8AC|nr:MULTISPECIES: Maf family protein [unclassified Wenzhouxiangella]RFF28428.1 septum formation inhibitor Maf [Wenzhouxiangella sp. 15181]RFP69945.1 septum formation inhibitor Maf [Wenzhouxiangella sp. 15190]